MYTGAVAFSAAHFGAGIGPIYLANVECSGSESNLTHCPHSSFVICSSGHGEDAGVRCQGTSFYYNFTPKKLMDKMLL